ncbi:MAG TPA: hypothetical protein VL974_11160 [Magnetospirillum sp.]|nr:hypothetical protein [Magnetospirillum sp.]
MAKHMPPIPPEQQTPHGGSAQSHDNEGPDPEKEARARDLAHQGRQGNIKQNTTHQGYQQDR